MSALTIPDYATETAPAEPQIILAESALFNIVKEISGVTADYELADYLGLSASTISNLRSKDYPISYVMVQRLSEKIGLSVDAIRTFAGDSLSKGRGSSPDGVTPLIKGVMDAMLEALKDHPGIKGYVLCALLEGRAHVSSHTVYKAKTILKKQGAITYAKSNSGAGYYLTADAPSEECQPMIRIMSKAHEMPPMVNMPKSRNSIEWSLRMLGGAA